MSHHRHLLKRLARKVGDFLFGALMLGLYLAMLGDRQQSDARVARQDLHPFAQAASPEASHVQ